MAKFEVNKFLMKIFTFISVLLILGVSTNTNGQEIENFDLDNYKWQNRVLLVFSPNTYNQDYRSQNNTVLTNSAGISERDLEVFYALKDRGASARGAILPDEKTDDLRNKFGISASDFTVLLIGKDGTEKLRSDEAVSAKDLFEEIDSMPMRKLEMKDGG